MRLDAFHVTAVAIALLGAAVTIFDLLPINKFYFFAGYVVLQYVVLATAWNIMGGYMGYVNFGTAGFFAVGAYTSVVLYNLMKAPLLLMIPVAGAVCALLGLGMGYLTLRLRGVFFAIATLAMAIVLETLVVNWDYVGGATGAYILRAREIAPFGDYVEFLFFVMLLLAIFAVTVARWIGRSKTGRGFASHPRRRGGRGVRGGADPCASSSSRPPSPGSSWGSPAPRSCSTWASSSPRPRSTSFTRSTPSRCR